MSLLAHLHASAALIEELTREEGLVDRMSKAIDAAVLALAGGKPLLVCGNGGSAADAMHIAGELVGRYKLDRPGLRVIALTADSAILTAWSNDFGYETVFSRQVEAYGAAGGMLLGLSTSGNSKNVVKAFEAARTLGMTTVALTGEGGGKLRKLSDVLLDVPSRDTPMIQQCHICLYHYFCAEVERALAPEEQART